MTPLNKAALRAHMRRARRELLLAARQAAHEAIAAALEPIHEAHPGLVGAFAPSPHEASPLGFIHRLEGRLEVVAWPRVDGTNLRFHLGPSGGLVPGYAGLAEPLASWPEVSPEAFALLLVPGLAFDPTGARLGQGGGFYDRILPRVRGFKVGICYGFQRVAAVPTHGHDARVDLVISDER